MIEGRTDAAAVVRHLKEYFAGTTGLVFLTSLPNTRGGRPGEQSITTRLPSEITNFVEKWDRPGRGLFFCVSTLKPDSQPTQFGSLRCKANCAELPCLFTDIDFERLKDEVENPQAEVFRRLQAMDPAPCAVNVSGGGLHAYWRLQSPIATAGFEAAEEALRVLTARLGGDPQCCEVARLLRLPGSVNSKPGR